VVHETDHSIHVAHRFKATDQTVFDAIKAAATALGQLSNSHILPVEAIADGIGGSTWLITPFTGSQDGLVTLDSLVKAKGGRMPAAETERALIQILEGIAAAHAHGCHHGPISAQEILIDRRGSLAVELYGIRRRLGTLWNRSAPEVARDEVRSVVELGYWMLTGLSAEDPRIAATRLFPKLDQRWDEWFSEGLDPLVGFTTAEDALAALPGLRREFEDRQRSNPVQTVLTRVRQAILPG
jgi:serine/threonine protein kinase